MIQVIKDDITKLNVDAIVNAANNTLLGGAGVDGAIHDAAGPELFRECRLLNGCETGKAKITKGYNLPAKHVIHAVGPIYFINKEKAPNLLKSCYQEALNLTKIHKLKSIAFPCISTGAYGYPNQEAAQIAYQTVQEFYQEEGNTDLEVTFCCFLQDDFQIYKDLMNDK